jgi:UDP-2,3-diacylglucosamine pyrophosphatase LpxH
MASNVERAKIKLIYSQLDELYDLSEKLECNENSKYVIFSDLHMGDGSAKDDFRQNSDLFKTAIDGYYLKKDFNLILNGDVEELLRFSLKKIEKKWGEVYEVFRKFDERNKFFKLIGNHDIALCLPHKNEGKFKIHHSLTLQSDFGDLLIFHGHQASMAYRRLNKMVGYTLRYLANPLRIKNYSVSHSSRKQYNIERRVYHHASFRKRVSIIGHTHRPLFESLTKAERLKYRIEQLCRKFAKADEKRKKPIRKLIKSHKKELLKIFSEKNYINFHSSIYHTIFHIPCLFNSGCVIGKRGMTCLEIEDNKIALVHWFDKKISDKYLDKRGYEPEQFRESDYYRMVLNKEYLNYIFSRINLLS